MTSWLTLLQIRFLLSFSDGSSEIFDVVVVDLEDYGTLLFCVIVSIYCSHSSFDSIESHEV